MVPLCLQSPWQTLTVLYNILPVRPVTGPEFSYIHLQAANTITVCSWHKLGTQGIITANTPRNPQNLTYSGRIAELVFIMK